MKHIKMHKVVFNHYYNDSDLNKVSSMKLNEYNEFVDEDRKNIWVHENEEGYLYLV